MTAEACAADSFKPLPWLTAKRLRVWAHRHPDGDADPVEPGHVGEAGDAEAVELLPHAGDRVGRADDAVGIAIGASALPKLDCLRLEPIPKMN